MIYHFCPQCGVAYGLQKSHMFSCENCHTTVYLNSKPTASVLIVDHDRILLGKRKRDPSKGRWDVIGGFLNYGEHPEEGALREAREETGLQVEIREYLGTFMDFYGPDQEATLNMCFLATVVGGELKPDDDIAELQWFQKDELPQDLAFENGKQMLEAWKQKR